MGDDPRDGLWQFAKELRGGRQEFLHHLSIPQDEFRAVMKLFLVAHVGPPIVQIEQFVVLATSCTVLLEALLRILISVLPWSGMSFIRYTPDRKTN